MLLCDSEENTMTQGSNQRLKLLYLMKVLLEKTDESHSITMQEILTSLKAYGINAERKSIYTDMDLLRQYGMDIIGTQENRTYHYHIGNRQFELAELKLLVDSIQAAKFLTTKKSNDLIKKIEGFASQYEASQLHRQVYVAERVKTMNESIYYNVDIIHSAINQNQKIQFQYFQWNVKKEIELRHNGRFYIESPWALLWDDENYYLIAFDSYENKIKHFRVDKMLKIDLINEKREGKQDFKDFDIAVYAKKMFGMFDGEEQIVNLECENRLAGVIIDRFGKDIQIIKKDEEHFLVNVKVAVSRHFLSWIMALGEGVKIVGPETVLKQVEGEIERLVRQYKAKS